MARRSSGELREAARTVSRARDALDGYVLPGIQAVMSSIVMSDIKRTTVLPI